MNDNEYRFSDELIGQVAKLLQMAILTGTDIVDNLRMIRVVTGDNDQLVMTDDYRFIADKQVEKLLEKASNTQGKTEMQTSQLYGIMEV